MKVEFYDFLCCFEKLFGRTPDEIQPLPTFTIIRFGEVEFEVTVGEQRIEDVYFDTEPYGYYMHSDNVKERFGLEVHYTEDEEKRYYVFPKGYLDET